MASFWETLFGSPASYEYVSGASPEQQDLVQQLIRALQGSGAGGGFGEAADYYRNILGDDAATQAQWEAPELRRFNEQIIPDLAEQFAGMGSGNLNSSSFRNAAVGAGRDLSERLAAMRANMKMGAAQGLQGLGSQALSPFGQAMRTPPTRGLFGELASGLGQGVGAGIAGPVGVGFGSLANQYFQSKFSKPQVGA